MAANHTKIGEAFDILLQAVVPYIGIELEAAYGQAWWTKGVLAALTDGEKRNLKTSGGREELEASLDVQRCLRVLDEQWHDVFRRKLSGEHRAWIKELLVLRNKVAHRGTEDISEEDTLRGLDTMSRFCEQLDPARTEMLRREYRKLRYGTEDGSTTVTSAAKPTPPARERDGVLSASPDAGLPGWRQIMEPHPDVAQGRYRNAEFAADLAQVARGEGTMEYRDPVEFFARTYVTEGLKGLLVQAVRRVAGNAGEPVIQLKTAFGGGKTHSLLALYHLMRSGIGVERLAGMRDVLDAAGVTGLPKVRVAVIVGTALDPYKGRRPPQLPGVTVNTLWGEIAAQFSIETGNPHLYEYVREADKKGVSPGSDVLKRLFDACGPCMVLLDELVAYARRIYGVPALPSGTFDNCITFIQQITEAARASKASLVVGSIPESDLEVGGEAGKVALKTIEHHFGRMESIWKPVAANEGFEVVRRRLFLDCKDPQAREIVCNAFSRMYGDQPQDFPTTAKEVEYRDRMVACYPIHPEVFERLYEEWAILERFQRTRGVLRLMAAVIHELWMAHDASLMIMPGSIPLDTSSVRDELTRHLGEGWNAIVDSEVDGRNSIPFNLDRQQPRFGKVLAMRRVARTIMLGSAPSVKEQRVRGIEASRVRLGVVQPGETVSIFNDALATLRSKLSHLYDNPSSDRFWYDVRPTLQRTMQDRASQFKASDVEHEIEKRLRSLKPEAPFTRIHVCPATSLDVPDEQTARIVVLRPPQSHRLGQRDSEAMKAVGDVLQSRGDAQRTHRNMLVFIGPEEPLVEGLKERVRECLAWRSIKEDSETLNLDATQNKQTETSLARSDDTVERQVREAWCWLFVPSVDPREGWDVKWEATRLSGGTDAGIVQKAVRQLRQASSIIEKWAPAMLLLELNRWLWKEGDDIQVKALWNLLTSQCYLPRLTGYGVLEEAVCAGLPSQEYFGYAAGKDDDGTYIDISLDKERSIDQTGYLVKADVTRRHVATQKSSDPVPAGYMPSEHMTSTSDGTDGGGRPELISSSTSTQSATSKPKHFFLSAPLDPVRIYKDVQRLVDEVIRHIQEANGNLEIRLEVSSTTATGFSPQTVQTVTENCKTLKVPTVGFDDN
ncbi:MAG: DUF499 domain-containing protein [Desulfovibrio sp.]|jgi:predicted AAA+ superfamily ATPase|nr:DUF499 domain-containing protein [Desulfovibrio sp.]